MTFYRFPEFVVKRFFLSIFVVMILFIYNSCVYAILNDEDISKKVEGNYYSGIYG